ncbi:beta-galactosidase [Edaphobacter acidisoli]|uniref:Beta-galactosidase n=1 Tax=Edaphobacter acidisoli TaxID=2040573 RepID=A0A916RGT5_9BACT|nr:beta-galactosidase [Edaphobacter acidisoli]GGA55444.1 beta-galactosidase [Edaphobacter acidisoli]
MRFAAFIAAILICSALIAQPAPTPYITPHAPLLGAAWYPEQWPESRWDADLQLMQDAHLNVVRVGEFAWSTEEPSEGHYNFDWLSRAIALAAKHHIAVVIGTPTDAPPAWLTSKYPDTLGTNADGRLRQHGTRRQFSYSSPHYREFCRQIVTELAKRFGHNPNVIGWQIDNEYTDESFDPATRRQFQQFLKAKYKTLDNLNRHWTTAYWSQTYTAWDQIPMENTGGNPGLLLDHKHFVTATWRSFQQSQIDALRPYVAPTQFITTNIGGLGWSDNWDHYRITQPLNLAAWDEYVGEGHLQVAKEAMMNDFVRGWKRQNFWLMETEPGSVNWAPINNTLDRGETRALAWQAVDHGADAVLYWQWRSALNGQEQYHGAIVGPDGTPLPIYTEIQQLGADFVAASPALAGTTPKSDVALITTYDSRWAIDFQPHTKLYEQQQILLDFYRPLESIAQSVDIVEATTNLAQYKLVVAPSLNVIPQSLADNLLTYVRAGGRLILGPRSGMKDQYNALNTQRQPGPLAAALGGRVEQFYALESPIPVGNGTASIWAEQLTVTNPATKVDLRYGKSNGWLDNQPAMITRSVGKGSITYLGTIPDPALMQSIMQSATASANIQPAFGPIPTGVEVCRRVAPDHTVYILINHGKATQQISLPSTMHEVFTNKDAATITLAPQGVAVLTTKAK